MRPRRSGLLGCMLASVLAAAAAGADLQPGKFLVARRNLPDPNFAESVVLLISYDKKGAMGLVINQPTKLTLSRLFKELKEAKGRSDPVFLGGPVEKTGALALLRSKSKPEDARHVLGEVYMVSSKPMLEKTLAAGTGPDGVRIYLGYTGWGAGQLDFELELGTWHVFPGDSGMVFDPDPLSVWSRLIKQMDLRYARTTPLRSWLGTEWLAAEPR